MFSLDVNSPKNNNGGRIADCVLILCMWLFVTGIRYEAFAWANQDSLLCTVIVLLCCQDSAVYLKWSLLCCHSPDLLHAQITILSKPIREISSTQLTTEVSCCAKHPYKRVTKKVVNYISLFWYFCPTILLSVNKP